MREMEGQKEGGLGNQTKEEAGWSTRKEMESQAKGNSLLPGCVPLFLFYNDFHFGFFPVVGLYGDGGRPFFLCGDFPGRGNGGHGTPAGGIGKLIAGRSFWEFGLDLELPSGPYGFGFRVQPKLCGFLFYGDLDGGFFPIGGFYRNFGGACFLGGYLPFGGYGEFLVGSSVSKFPVFGICREGGCL